MEQANTKIKKLKAILNQDQLLQLAEQPTLKVGVDLGTSSIVLVVLDEHDEPLFGAFEYARAVRDGLVVNYRDAVDCVKRLKAKAEASLSQSLTKAAGAIPPGTIGNNKKVVANVIESAGMDAVAIVDEPTAAAAVLDIKNGAVVDVGGGTTGISVFNDGKVTYTADEPTGGFHMSLVLAGHYGCTVEEAEKRKREKEHADINIEIMRPVIEKMAEIIRRHLEVAPSESIYLVGGATTGDGFMNIFSDYLKASSVYHPLFPVLITPYGIAMYA